MMKQAVSSARWLLTAIALFTIVTLLSTRTAAAAGVVGNGTPGSCTETAFDNALVGGGTVTFNCGANPVTIVMTFYKTISASTVVDGGNKITLQGSNAAHFLISSGQTATIKNLVLSNGKGSGFGSISNFGTLKIIHVTFNKNVSNSHGGAIANYGSLVVKNSTFLNNKATNGGGGAVWNDGGNAKVKGSTFTANTSKNADGGGALGNHAGTLTVTGGVIHGNKAIDGGGIWNDYGTTNTISKVTLNNNHASNSGGGLANLGDTTLTLALVTNNSAVDVGGGITHGGSLEISKSTIGGNLAGGVGGGLRDFGDSLDIQQSTFSNNKSSEDGGGLYTNSHPGVRNSTFSGNQASSGHGGAIYSSNADVNLEYVTIANNTAMIGGGVAADSSQTSSIYMQNVVLSNNTGDNCDGSELLSGGHNLSSDNTCSNVFTEQGDKNNQDPKLGPLASNGGPTKTHLPLAGSPLINKGYTDNHIDFDQRNFHRPVGSSADIGAVEVQ